MRSHGGARLAEALDVFLAHRQEPTCDDGELLRRHPELRDLLEPLLAEPGGPVDQAADDRPERGVRDDDQRTIGDYRLLREVGRGAAGVVYEAEHRQLGRRVALKVLAAALVHEPHAVARFRREGELLARLSHPQIVPVHDAGVVGGVPFHAMEYVDGSSLEHVLATLRGLDPARCDGATFARSLRRALDDPDAGATLVARSHVEAAVRLAHGLALALACAHEHGVLHRDVKPANVLLRRDGSLLLGDFGLARDVAEPGLTRAGGFLGTAHYVAPEQAAGRLGEVGAASDVFSLGVVLYEMLWLQRPFGAGSTDEILCRVGTAEPPELRRRGRGVPADLVAVVERALQKQPADRYPSMQQFADDLRCVLELRPVRARRSGALVRGWRRMRRHPRASLLLAALSLTTATAVGALVYVDSQSGRIRAAAQLELAPRVERHLEAAMLGVDGGDLAAAQDAVDAAGALLPQLPEVVAVHAYLRLLRGDRDGAEAVVDQLGELAPELAQQYRSGAAADAEPTSSLGWFVRGLHELHDGHALGQRASYEAAADALRHAMDRSATPRSLYHCQCLHALTHLRDEPALRALADDALHLWPDSPFVAYWRGFALQSYDATAARAEFERALALWPDLREAHVRLAKLDEVAGELAAAERRLRALVVQWPARSHLRVLLARLLRKRGALDAAAVELAQADEGDRPSDKRTRIERAWLLADRGELAEAEVAARAAFEATPELPAAVVCLAGVLVRRGRVDEARRLLEPAIERWPEDHDLLRANASACLAARAWHEAAEQLRNVLALCPDDVGSWCDLATIRRRQGDLDEAERLLAEARARDPEHWLMHLQTGHVLRARDRDDEAERAFRAALAANPDEPEARINLAGFHLRRGERDEALALLAEARRVRASLWQAWRPSIVVLQQLGRYGEAEGLLHDWCRSPHADGRAWLQLAQLRRRSPEHDLASAELALRQAASMLSDADANVLAERGEQLLAGGDTAGARACFERALGTTGLSSRDAARCRERLRALSR